MIEVARTRVAAAHAFAGTTATDNPTTTSTSDFEERMDVAMSPARDDDDAMHLDLMNHTPVEQPGVHHEVDSDTSEEDFGVDGDWLKAAESK